MRKKRLIQIFVHACISTLVVFITLVIAVVLHFWHLLPTVDSIESLLQKQTTVLYDREGSELFRLFQEEDRFHIQLDALPKYVVQSIIAIEDERFYSRSCIDPIAITRAYIANLQKEKSEGASTITQQLVRSLYLTPEKTYERKIKEIAIACKFESRFTKDEILTMYINWISFGGSNYGIEQAAQSYFGIHAHELSIAEASILAAMIQRPTYFSPYGKNVHSSVGTIGLLPIKIQSENLSVIIPGRSTFVLRNLVQLGYITRSDLQIAEADLLVQTFAPRGYQISAPHFVFWLQSKLEHTLKNTTGYQVNTTIHSGLQRIAETTVYKHIERVRADYHASNISLLAIDRNTREVLAYVGNTDYFDTENGQVDMIQTPRQPGSSIKPFIYAAAFLHGLLPDSIIYDSKITIGTDTPRNYEGGFLGRLTVRQALARSRNIPAIKAYFLAGGEESVLRVFKKVGMYTPEILRAAKRKYNRNFTFGWPMSIGSAEVTLFELVQGYSVLANHGVLKPIQPIRTITNSQKQTVFVQSDNDAVVQSMPPAVADNILDILSDADARPSGTWRNTLTLPNGSAVKTGTSNKCIAYYNSVCTTIAANNTWIVGMNSNLIVGVWVGNADGKAMQGNADGISTAAPIWHDFFTESSLFY